MKHAYPLAIALFVAATASDAAMPVFDKTNRAVTTWRAEAKDNLALSPVEAEAFAGPGAAPPVARCVKLNNYWCIKAAGWDGEIAADNEGHVAFASAEAGAAGAALLLKRYYVDFGRKTALAIITRWAPAPCGLVATGVPHPSGRKGFVSRSIAPEGIGGTLRAQWLAAHKRGFAPRLAGSKPVRRSVVADPIQHSIPAPTIAVGLGEVTRPMTLDALLRASPNAPPSRSMLGLPRAGHSGTSATRGTGCASDGTRTAGYAAKAAANITTGPGGDLMLFTPDGVPTPNLATMMTNMARVEIGPHAAKPALIEAGIAAAFAPGRNPPKP